MSTDAYQAYNDFLGDHGLSTRALSLSMCGDSEFAIAAQVDGQDLSIVDPGSPFTETEAVLFFAKIAKDPRIIDGLTFSNDLGIPVFRAMKEQAGLILGLTVITRDPKLGTENTQTFRNYTSRDDFLRRATAHGLEIISPK